MSFGRSADFRVAGTRIGDKVAIDSKGNFYAGDISAAGDVKIKKCLKAKELNVGSGETCIVGLSGKQLSSDKPFSLDGSPDVSSLYFTAGTKLYSFDVLTSQKQLIGDSGVTFFDIAISPSLELFGISDDGKLYSISTVNGAASLVATPEGSFNSLAFDSEGVLYALDGPTLTIINKSTGSTLALGNTLHGSMGDIVFFEGVLFLASSNGTLVRFPDINNLSNHTVVGSFDVTEGLLVYGLAQLKLNSVPKLYGTSADFRIFEINPLNAELIGVVQLSSDNSVDFIAGATSQCWSKAEHREATLLPVIKVPDGAALTVTLQLTGKDEVTYDVHSSCRMLSVKNFEEFHIRTLSPAIAVFGEGTLPANDVVLHYLADSSSFLIKVVSKSPNNVKWSGTATITIA